MDEKKGIGIANDAGGEKAGHGMIRAMGISCN